MVPVNDERAYQSRHFDCSCFSSESVSLDLDNEEKGHQGQLEKRAPMRRCSFSVALQYLALMHSHENMQPQPGSRQKDTFGKHLIV